MKRFNSLLLCGVLCAGALCISSSSFAGPKWKGSWYLRGLDQCREIVLDKKGRSDVVSYPKAIVEKKGEYYFLTLESMGEKFSYKMLPKEDTKDYFLDLISVGPNQPLPTGAKDIRVIYSGMYRKLVDCQVINPELTETTLN